MPLPVDTYAAILAGRSLCPAVVAVCSKVAGARLRLRVGEDGEVLEVKGVNRFGHFRSWTNRDHTDRQLCL